MRSFWLKTSSSLLRNAETGTLNYHVNHPYQMHQVEISNQNYINVLEAAPKEPCKGTIVLMHGFGLGLPFWYLNINTLVDNGYKVIAMDWLGMGGSSRPKFEKRTICHSTDIDQAESFFIDSLEECRKQLKLSKFHLVGHSLGGYLSALYAIKYPDAVQHLILASPVGLPDIPTQEKMDIPWIEKLFLSAWSLNITPQDILRILGPWGIDFMHGILKRRFNGQLSDEEGTKRMSEYMYHMSVASASGEYAMNTLLHPYIAEQFSGVYARRPIGKKLAELTCPTLVIFGQNDWLYHPSVPQLCPNLQIVPQAGHHLYLDNAVYFNRLILNFLNS